MKNHRISWPMLAALFVLNAAMWGAFWWKFESPLRVWQAFADWNDAGKQWTPEVTGLLAPWEREATLRTLATADFAQVQATMQPVMERIEEFEADPALQQEMVEQAALPFVEESVFQRELAYNGVTEKSVVHVFRAFAEGVASPVEIQDAPVEEGELWLPELMEARHIFLIASASMTPEEEVRRQGAKMDAIAERLAAGEKFEDLAREISEDPASAEKGGLLPVFTPDQLPEVFREKVANLEPGEVSEVFYEPTLGWHIVRLERRDPPRVADFPP